MGRLAHESKAAQVQIDGHPAGVQEFHAKKRSGQCACGEYPSSGRSLERASGFVRVVLLASLFRPRGCARVFGGQLVQYAHGGLAPDAAVIGGHWGRGDAGQTRVVAGVPSAGTVAV